MDKFIKRYSELIGCNPKEELTGLFTPGFFFYYIETLIQEYKNDSKDLSFVLTAVELNSLDVINKNEGYLSGDLILKSFGNIIEETIRDKDLATRISGNTFLIFFYNLNPGEEYNVINRIRLTMTNKNYKNLSMGTGFATYPQNGVNISQLKELALINLDYSRHSNIQGDGAEPGNWISVEGINILIVDDDEKNRKLLKAMIEPLKYNIFLAESGESALVMIKRQEFDIVLLDAMMPGVNGFEVCKILKSSEETWQIPIIMVTALDDIDSKIRGIEAGADDFIVKPPRREEITARIKSLVRLRQVNRNYTSIENVLLSLANAVEAKDSYTQGHTERVSILAEKLGRIMNLPEKDIIALRLGGILHDVGKIAVPIEILNKPGPLNDEEWKIMKSHTDIGYNICLPLSQTLGGALDIIRHHHEKMDGSSYPDGLSGDAISVNSRILSIVDIYDALTSDRPYRKSMDKEYAITILKESASNNLLDKKIVDILIKLIKDGKNKLRRKDDSFDNKHKKILIVEDDPLNFKLMKTLLQFNKFNVDWIESAENMINKIEEFHPDLILMDIQLPGTDGLEATRLLKKSDIYKDIPIIAVSAHAMEENKIEAEAAGCIAYITKPLDTRTFANSVGEFL
ncbi:MAG: response regulator [Spirochaetales bacterium]|nr:response regulator [Spirochaetales bacterium]